MNKNYRVVFPECAHVAIEESDIPTPNEGELLIKTRVSQISIGTELTMLMADVDPDSTWINDEYHIAYPEYPGYSNVGEVIGIGQGVSDDWIGKRVYTSGPHSMYYTYPEKETIEVPKSVSDEQAVACTIARIACGNVRFADICFGENVLVFGAGIIGQMVSRLAKLSGAHRVIVADISKDRLEYVPKEIGFCPLDSSKEDFLSTVKEICGGELPAYVFETTGNQKITDFELRFVRPYGKLIITSSPKGKSIVDLDYTSRQQINIIGGLNGRVHPVVDNGIFRWTQDRDSRFLLKLFADGSLPVENLITHKYCWKDAVEAYEMLMNDRSKAMSVLIDWKDKENN